MAEDSNIILANSDSQTGTIEIAPEVVEVIAGIAASQVDGVYSMRGSLASSLNELFGRKNRGKGVKISRDGENLRAEVYAFLNYGVAVPKVALEIQEKVKQQLLFMTGLKLSSVDVYVQGVVPKKQAAAVDPDDLFAEENGEKK
ncbi:Asp23/Gls24 family envelope stress response protein [Liquorilactobacillus vini]|uniref:Alkaline shock protein n=2 Tax=Liquorilactobacillus vini TaxID=238015 RepID=A0A0R2CDQ8_9LACO|nr:Asp23/Gls24 family envelope stress response protein [Liquorilactobacillus vini]KRM86521.1 alkaline shock protein [Liquorilactobacillus vini DSM 20605]